MNTGAIGIDVQAAGTTIQREVYIAAIAGESWCTDMHEELVKELRGEYGYDTRKDIRVMKAAADAIEELSTIVEGYRKRMWAGSDWIPVDEQLPEDFKKVLAFWREHSEPIIDTAFWMEDSKSFNCSHWERAGEKVTHWMPLPPAPKEE